jgi:hypothetical protein
MHVRLFEKPPDDPEDDAGVGLRTVGKACFSVDMVAVGTVVLVG